jgi:hypothetical protein
MEFPLLRQKDLGPKGLLEVQYSLVGNFVTRVSITLNGEPFVYEGELPNLDEISPQSLGVMPINPIDEDFATIVDFLTL